MAIIAASNQTEYPMDDRLIDQIIAFKKKCNLDERIGSRFNLSNRDVSCLYFLSSSEMNSKDLAAGIGVSPSRGSRLVNQLINRGFITVQSDSHDRRNQLLRLSSEGEECLAALESEKEACEKLLTDQLEGDQLEMVRKGINLLMRLV